MARLLEGLLKGRFGYRIVLFTAPRHLDGVINEKGTTLRALLQRHTVTFCESEDINSDARLSETVTKNSLGLSLGAAWPFEKKTVSLFSPGHLLDVMGVDLPRYRGGAHYTWQILHGNRQGAVNLQVVLGGKETFHNGPILKNLRYAISKEAEEPIDYFNFCLEKEMSFLISFLREVKKGKTYALRELDERRSSSYPFLSTPHQGWINWGWNGGDVVSFIGAFGDPYKGASTYLGGRRVYLKGCGVQKAEERYHPFTSGIVVRRNNEGVFVATKGVLLRITRVCDEDGRDITSEIVPGLRFHTPSSTLDDALRFSALYGAKGLTRSAKKPQ